MPTAEQPSMLARWAALPFARNGDLAQGAAGRVKPQPHRGDAIPSLDGIRAISVLIVVMGHSGLEVVPGGLGVTIFFFLSGYLITTLLLAEHERSGGINIANFYTRRFFRLMPPLLISLVIAYSLVYARLLSGGMTGTGLAAQLLYFANYYGLFFVHDGNSIPDGTGILWSLAVEEHFYIVYPVLMALILGLALRPRTVGTFMVAACVGILLWRIYLVHSPNFYSDRTYYASDTRIDSIIYGCILAVVLNPKTPVQGSRDMSPAHWVILAAAVGTLFVSVAYRDPAFRETFRYSIQGLALMPIFYFAIRFSNNWLFNKLSMPWLVTLGTYSYAIYLIHYVVIRAIVKNFPAAEEKVYIIFPAALLISIVYAALVDRFVDPYFRRLRRKYGPGITAGTPALQRV